MKYTKQPLSISGQIAKLQSRGLNVDNGLATECLSNISYYRLRAYTFPFQDNSNPEQDHRFIKKDIHLSDIIDLYGFDHQLRTLIFDAIEKIEVAVRTKITYTYSLALNNSHWFMTESLFKDDMFIRNHASISKYEALMVDVEKEVDRSNEDFIKHYFQKYNDPDIPPSWMTLEVVSFSMLSRIYQLLKKDATKSEIATQFGLPNAKMLENWLHALANLRNSCAHHSRIWNRRFMVHVQLPYNTIHPFMTRKVSSEIKQNKLFAVLSCMKYLLDIISPGNDFRNKLSSAISQGGRLVNIKDMGFPKNWIDLDVWKDREILPGSKSLEMTSEVSIN